ncbi:unnamed protein product [Protopolystoma xenopodis]|uniref:Uncharacterized protein n=1 Tax=Protopolystoma xenopodis TaxID=117903 RepID=A0A3S5AC44_9PLAT|nr:unnamed protein product [Protopolystoma xenopodis]
MEPIPDSIDGTPFSPAAHLRIPEERSRLSPQNEHLIGGTLGREIEGNAAGLSAGQIPTKSQQSSPAILASGCLEEECAAAVALPSPFPGRLDGSGQVGPVKMRPIASRVTARVEGFQTARQPLRPGAGRQTTNPPTCRRQARQCSKKGELTQNTIRCDPQVAHQIVIGLATSTVVEAEELFEWRRSRSMAVFSSNRDSNPSGWTTSACCMVKKEAPAQGCRLEMGGWGQMRFPTPEASWQVGVCVWRRGQICEILPLNRPARSVCLARVGPSRHEAAATGRHLRQISRPAAQRQSAILAAVWPRQAVLSIRSLSGPELTTSLPGWRGSRAGQPMKYGAPTRMTHVTQFQTDSSRAIPILLPMPQPHIATDTAFPICSIKPIYLLDHLPHFRFYPFSRPQHTFWRMHNPLCLYLCAGPP